MAIKTKLATRYWIKTVIMIVVCVVLGLWGIWDYVVTIPSNSRGAARAVVLRDIKNGFDTPRGSVERGEAITVASIVIEKDTTGDTEWISSLEQMREGLRGGTIEAQRAAMGDVEEGLNEYGHIVAPSKYDRPMQWIFILCLPFGFYYLYAYLKMSKKADAYYLDDGGQLTTPEGTWGQNEIKDIDMSTWISKTGKVRLTWTANVIVNDGKRILLDDYVYQNMHLIIGDIAHRFYPEEWTPLAKRVRPDGPEDIVEFEEEQGE